MIPLKTGNWRGVLHIQDEKEIPFTLVLKSDTTMVMHNADEKILVDEININGDSILIKMPVFEGVFKGIIDNEERITGEFSKPSLGRNVSFEMNFSNEQRFKSFRQETAKIEGVWEAVFSPNTEEDRYIAKGIFYQNGSTITGTFRTTTGDYRYLEGTLNGDKLQLSTFDGAHAFLFEAIVTDSTMTGFFYSGNHWKEPFVAKRNSGYELPKATSLTYLKDGYESIDFSFPMTNEKMISLSDERYKNKVVVVQIMGTWCPNCLDETKYYSQYYNLHKNDNIEFVALAFEYAKTEKKAFNSINRFQEKINVPYPILLAQFGTSDKNKANEKLPMLNHILSYPTTIFIDKKGKVRRIHTGFNGPATGDVYLEFTKDFEGFVAKLIEE
ncbi:MAG: TlpA disulfide reductase family protein [Flavobacteriaceae bacterium]